jgi:ABC-type branched-subunit amino acid transport system substrate-binding protein
VLHAATPAGRALAETVEQHLRGSGWQQLSLQRFVPGSLDTVAFVQDGRTRDVRTVFVLGAGADVRGIAHEAARAGWFPLLLVPGPLTSRDIAELPTEFEDKVFLAFPTALADQTPEVRQQYDALLKAAPRGRAYQTLQVPAYAAALTVVEVLKRTGRDLTRQKFVAAFETLVNYETGMLPPLSYNADRRIGALGAHVVQVDRAGQLRPTGPFIPLR